MFQLIFDTYSSREFYGYANGDIQFDETLLETLQSVATKLPDLNKNVLLAGQRYSINANLSKPESIYLCTNLKKLAQSRSMDGGHCEDYFIFTRNGSSLNWTAIRDVVIGRPAYDNYLVATAIKMKVNVIDCSKTILAVHLTTPNVRHEGTRQKDSSYNARIIGRFNYFSGRLNATKLLTAYDHKEMIQVIRR